MENASKALLIAAGILMGIILITMMVYGYNQISSYYATKEKAKESEQIADFNKQYIGYNRDDVRGSDLISLVNKIIDYNVDDMNYVNDEKIEITIIIDNTNTNGKAETFFFNYNTYYNSADKLINLGTSGKCTYTYKQGDAQAEIYTKLIYPANEIENTYTQAMSTKLASNISTLMNENTRKTADDLFTELKITPATYGKTLTQMQKDILRYYQYVQFKRAHFDCTDLTYKNGRVKSFTFEFNGKFE